MAKISPVGSNMTVLHGKKYDVLFSYETPVAAKDIKTGEVFKTSKKWSVTTSKHISKWLAGEKASEKPQEFFDDLDESKKDPAKQIAEALDIMLKGKSLKESTSDWSNKQVIDSRDIIERLQELEDDVENLDESDKEELELLRAVNEDGQNYSGDWENGELLINDSYWVDYVQEMLEDTGDIPKDLPHYIVINWDSTAINVQSDYASIDVGGNAFWIRNS